MNNQIIQENTGFETYTENGKSYFKDASYPDGSKNTYDIAIQEYILAYKNALMLNSGKDREKTCLFNLASAYIEAEYFSRGVEVLLSILNMPATEDGPSKGDVLYKVGLAHEKMKQEQKAAKYYQDALSEYRLTSISFSPLLCEALVNLGKLYACKGEITQAGDLFVNAAKRYFKQSQYEQGCYALLYKADALISQTKLNISECRSLLEECVEYILKIQDSDTQSKLLNDVGLKLTLLSDYDKALKCFEASLRICSAYNRTHKGHILQNIGAVYNRTEKYHKALTYHGQSVDIHGEIGNRNAQGQCFCNLAYAQSQLAIYDSARDNYNHALQAFRDTGDKEGEWQVYEGLGAISVLFSQIDKAVFFYQQAIKAQALSKNIESVAQDRLVSKLTYVLGLSGKQIVFGERGFLKSRDPSNNTLKEISTPSRRKRSIEAVRLPKLSSQLTEIDSPYHQPRPPSRSKSSVAEIQLPVEKFVNEQNVERILPVKNDNQGGKIRYFNRGRRGYQRGENKPFLQVARGLSNVTDFTVRNSLEDNDFEDSDIDIPMVFPYLNADDEDSDIDFIQANIPPAIEYKGVVYSPHPMTMMEVARDLQSLSTVTKRWKKNKAREVRPLKRGSKHSVLFEEPSQSDFPKERSLSPSSETALKKNKSPVKSRSSNIEQLRLADNGGGLSMSEDEDSTIADHYKKQLKAAEDESRNEETFTSVSSSSSVSENADADNEEHVPFSSIPVRNPPEPPKKPPRTKFSKEDSNIHKNLRFSPQVEEMGASTHLYATIPTSKDSRRVMDEKNTEETLLLSGAISSPSIQNDSYHGNVVEEDGNHQTLPSISSPSKDKKSSKSKFCVIM